jgi:hypothetical protein
MKVYKCFEVHILMSFRIVKSKSILDVQGREEVLEWDYGGNGHNPCSERYQPGGPIRAPLSVRGTKLNNPGGIIG